MSKNIKFFIVASVILNVVLGGLVLGHVSNRYGEESSEASQAMQALSAEKQAQLKQAMDAMRQERRDGREETQRLRLAALESLGAERFDRATYNDRVKKIHAMKQAQLQRMADRIADMAKDWSQEERQALATILREKMNHRHHRHAPQEPSKK